MFTHSASHKQNKTFLRQLLWCTTGSELIEGLLRSARAIGHIDKYTIIQQDPTWTELTDWGHVLVYQEGAWRPLTFVVLTEIKNNNK